MRPADWETSTKREKGRRFVPTGARAGALRRSKVAARGGRSPSYDDWTKDDLMKRAREIGISGRSSMTKAELIKALRNH